MLGGGAAVAGQLSGLTPACIGVYGCVHLACGMLGGVTFGDQGVIYLCGLFALYPSLLLCVPS